MSELPWNWAFYPHLDPPEKQKESALKAGYIKVVNKDDADKVIAKLKSKTGIVLQKGKLDTFNSVDLVNEFLGDCFKTYSIPVIETDEAIVVG